MVVLPALVEEDLAAFGSGLTEVQRLVGEMFRPVQGERFAHPLVAELVDELLAGGAAGAGQSSWGPAVYGLVRGEEAARSLAAPDRAPSLRGAGSSSRPASTTAALAAGPPTLPWLRAEGSAIAMVNVAVY